MLSLSKHSVLFFSNLVVSKAPSEYVRSEQVYYSFEPNEHRLSFVIDFVGEDRLLFASDYNHSDSKFPHSVEAVTPLFPSLFGSGLR